MKNFVDFKRAIAVLTFTFLIYGSYGQAPSQPLGTFLGEWKGEGTLFGSQASFSMIWQRELDGAFYALSFHNEFLDHTGKKVHLKAVAYYRQTAENQFSGYWFDSRGMILPLTAIFNKDRLETTWGDDTTEKGKTTYRLMENGTVEVTDYILKTGLSMEFGKASYTKAID